MCSKDDLYKAMIDEYNYYWLEKVAHLYSYMKLDKTIYEINEKLNTFNT